jgi:hypothetical protein
METSDRRNIDSVVRLVRTDESDVAHPIAVIHGDDQPVPVPADVEHDAVLADDTRIGVDTLYICWRAPIGTPNIVVPRPQWSLGVHVFFPELPQRTPGNDTHFKPV